MAIKQDLFLVLKMALVIGALFMAEHFYDSSKEKQELVDDCVQSMIFRAAMLDGFWVERNDISSRRIDGRLVVMTSASKPLDWADLEQVGNDKVPVIGNESMYMIRCVVHQNGIYTSFLVEKQTSSNTWEPIDRLE